MLIWKTLRRTAMSDSYDRWPIGPDFSRNSRSYHLAPSMTIKKPRNRGTTAPSAESLEKMPAIYTTEASRRFPPYIRAEAEASPTSINFTDPITGVSSGRNIDSTRRWECDSISRGNVIYLQSCHYRLLLDLCWKFL